MQFFYNVFLSFVKKREFIVKFRKQKLDFLVFKKLAQILKTSLESRYKTKWLSNGALVFSQTLGNEIGA